MPILLQCSWSVPGQKPWRYYSDTSRYWRVQSAKDRKSWKHQRFLSLPMLKLKIVKNAQKFPSSGWNVWIRIWEVKLFGLLVLHTIMWLWRRQKYWVRPKHKRLKSRHFTESDQRLRRMSQFLQNQKIFWRDLMLQATNSWKERIWPYLPKPQRVQYFSNECDTNRKRKKDL